jgi:hypothetical protein
MAENSFLQWLGRQVGYVAKAVKTDVTAPPPAHPGGELAKVVYRKDTVQEAAHPNDPELKLRRTIIDEVVKEKKT